jgi:hypothetical protein
MSEPIELKVVGKITPPDYKDPVQMLRNIADDLEAGRYGDVETIVVATNGTNGLEMFGGGRASDAQCCAFVFGAAQVRLLSIPWGGV